MRRHFIAGIVALLVLEAGAFTYWNRDLVGLSRSADVLAADPAFDGLADTAIARDSISRRVLERIAEVAARRGNFALQASALRRIALSAPDDGAVQLRLADALRAAGALDAADAIYTTWLARTSAGGQP